MGTFGQTPCNGWVKSFYLRPPLLAGEEVMERSWAGRLRQFALSLKKASSGALVVMVEKVESLIVERSCR